MNKNQQEKIDASRKYITRLMSKNPKIWFSIHHVTRSDRLVLQFFTINEGQIIPITHHIGNSTKRFVSSKSKGIMCEVGVTGFDIIREIEVMIYGQFENSGKITTYPL